jgi:cytochrome c-type biogenesis protein CcsB
MINQELAQFSNLLIVVAIVVYVLALLGFGADLAGVSQRRSDAKLEKKQVVARPATVAAGGGATTTTTPGATTTLTGEPRTDAPGTDVPRAGTARPDPRPGGTGKGATTTGQGADGRSLSARSFAYIMATIAVVAQGGGMILRGISTQRVPWGNMYEFTMTSTTVIVALFLIFSTRRKDLRLLGTFVVLPVLIGMLIAQTAWILPAAQLTPSLQNSHWVVVHVGVAIIATALSGLGALVAVLQLVASKFESTLEAKRVAGEQTEGTWGPVGSVLLRLPDAKHLEALCFRIHALAFVCWTFTLIFGAIWANKAWGRYWNWDPKEVWTFVIWVVYAVYLHARATRGFRGNKAAWFALAGFACVIINYTVVNLWINGLHSYSGLG